MTLAPHLYGSEDIRFMGRTTLCAPFVEEVDFTITGNRDGVTKETRSGALHGGSKLGNINFMVHGANAVRFYQY